MNSLLLLVDLQRDYLASPGLEPPAGAVERRARELVAGCRSLGVPVAHLWTTVSRAEDRRMPHWRRDGRWLCEEGTPGHRPPAGLEPRDGEAVLHKTSYSLNGHLELPERLDRLVVAGLHLHACVREAVLDAYTREGLEIWVAEDAVGSDDPLHSASTRRWLERRAARFLRVDEALAELEWGHAAVPPLEIPAPEALKGGVDREVLGRVADLLDAAADELAQAMAAEIAKPVRYGRTEVSRSARMLRAVAAESTGASPAAAGPAQVHRRPLGVVAAITPWNSPLYIPLGKIAPALAYGNAVLWKPAPAARRTSARLMELLSAAGVPAAAVGLVQGGRRAAEAVMAHPGVDAVTLTGSTAAGYCAQEICARRHIPLQAELGGNNAAVVWADADLVHAARRIAEGAFGQAGQRCTANRRVVVHRDRTEELLDLLRRETAALAWGDPRDPDTVVGPLVDAAARDRIADVVVSAREAIVPHGVAEPSGDGAWYPPTIVSCDDPSDDLVQREAFGPVLVVQTADDWEGAVELVNGVRQGLAAALFTSSQELMERFPREAAAGVVKLGRSTADAEVGVPFGGWKASGVGPPEHGEFDRHFYTRPQAVYR